MTDDHPLISPTVQALRDGLPGIHAWFTLADEQRAAAGVRDAVLSRLLLDIGGLDLQDDASSEYATGWTDALRSIINLIVLPTLEGPAGT